MSEGMSDRLFAFGQGRPDLEEKAWKALEQSFYCGDDWDSRQVRLNSRGMYVFRAGIARFVVGEVLVLIENQAREDKK